MVSIVINYVHSRRLSAQMKAPVHAAKLIERLTNRFNSNIQADADRDRRGSVQNVVHARNMQRKFAQILFAIAHPESAQRLPMAPHQASCIASIQLDVKVRAALGSISQSAPLHAWQQPPQ